MTAKDFPVTIIDVSEWQGRPPGIVREQDKPMDWSIAVTKAYAAIIKATSGYKRSVTNSYYDPAWEYNARESKAVGMARGYYHLLAPENTLKIKPQLDNFLEALARYPTELPPALDIEVPRPGAMTKNTLLSNIEKAIKYMQDNGYDPMIYTRATWWDDALYLAWTNSAWRCLLWVAQYNSKVAQPMIPQEWSRKGKTWTFWQWSADGNGRAVEFGCHGAPWSDDDIDISVFNGTLAGFNEKFGLHLQPLPGVVLPPGKTFKAGDPVTITAVVNPRRGPGVNTDDLGTLVKGSKTIAAGPSENRFVPLVVYVAEDYVEHS